MKHHTNTRRGWLLSTAASTMTLAMALSGQAAAQDDTGDDAEVITVRGFRAAVETAIEVKRASTSSVEAISAEDIGRLPDNSIAESLARLPGLAAQRLRGRAQVISVRGLGPDFTTALLNGREQVTAGDNRGVEFDQYPSELLSSVVVYKTPDAQLVGQGLAGTADLRTIRPLEQNEQTVSLSARYEWNEYGALNAGSDDSGHRITGFYVDQFANDTVGLALGFASQSSPTQGERWDAWGYPTVGAGELVIGGAKPYVESRTLERTAFVGTLELEPNSQWHTTIDAFYSQFEDNGILRGIELPLQWSGASLQPGYTVENGLVTQGQFNGVQGVVRNDTRAREADVFAFGINQQFRPNDDWLLEADLSFSSVDRSDVDLETYTGTGSGFGNGASDNLGFSLGEGGFVFNSSLNYADPSLMLLTDPQGWGQAGFIKRPSTTDELTALRLSAEREFSQGWISSIEGGIYFTDREKNKTSEEDFIDLANGGASNTTPIPSNLLLAPTALDFLGIAGMVSYDPLAMLNAGVYSLRPNTNADVLTKTWGVTEQQLMGYVQFNVDSMLGDTPVRGNFGVQIVNTEQESTGPRAGQGAILSFTEGDEYTEVLPSANFSFEIAENTFIRLGAARTLARPRMDELRASQEIGINNNVCTTNGGAGGTPTFDAANYDLAGGQSCLTVSGGSPVLRPYIADSFDISFERYFADGGGYFSAALFHKELSDYVFGSSAREIDMTDAATAIFGSSFLAANPQIGTGILYEPVNTEGGYIQGIELATNIPGDVIAPWLEGFGVMASYSYTDSEVQPDPNAGPIAIPGLSERVGNITLYYENDNGFSARVSNRWRSEFLGEVTGFGANRDFRSVEAESVVDAQIGGEFVGGRFDGFSVYLQGNNLTDEEFVTFLNDDPRQVKDYQTYGATYLLGISWRR